MPGRQATADQDIDRSRRSATPALAPHLLADRAGNPRPARLNRDDARVRRAACDLEHELGADGVLELLTLANRNDECARPANHAILVVDIQVLDIERHRDRAL